MSISVLQVVNATTPETDIIEQAVQLLEEGQLIVAPTETRYGLLARADEQSALDRLYAAKGRPKAMPTAVFLPDSRAIGTVAEITPAGQKLIDAFLPGPMTLVLKATAPYGRPVVVKEKIGIRVSTAPFIQALLEKLSFPVTATSANLSGEDESDDADSIARVFGSKVRLYIDAGKLTGEASTVVDASTDPVAILREGAIKESTIQKVINP